MSAPRVHCNKRMRAALTPKQQGTLLVKPGARR
jgi:hypothetical protein